MAISALLAGGWGAQPLATELIDDLRQVFLAALAPDLCAVAGAERDRYTGLAEAMGLPRVVRSIEILGQALIDMRDAPDAQVVLEIALVRAVRPDLDSGAGGAVRAGRGARALAGGRAGLPPAAARRVVAPAAAAPAAAPDRRAAAAAAAEAGDAARRRVAPSLGALRRSKQAPAPAPVALPVEAAMSPSDEPVSDDAAPRRPERPAVPPAGRRPPPVSTGTA